MKTAARQGPWAVHCSAEGASAASTVSVTCEFAATAGRFQPRLVVERIEVSRVSQRGAAKGHLGAVHNPERVKIKFAA